MIPAQNIVAWGNLVPWTDARQIEQDLIISRALVEIFSDRGDGADRGGVLSSGGQAAARTACSTVTVGLGRRTPEPRPH